MSDRLKKVTGFLSDMNKKYQKKYNGNIVFGGHDLTDFKPFETGFPLVDHVNSGIGGFPRGGMTLIHGKESSGKSTFVLEAAKNHVIMFPDTHILYLDVENALTREFIKYKELDPSKLSITNINSEDGLDVAEKALRDNVFDMIVIDSLAKIDSEKSQEKDINETVQRSTRASLLASFFKRTTCVLRASNTALVCINQEMENQNRKTQYDPETIVPGGRQQFHSANLRLQITRSKAIKKGDEKVGYIASIVSKKNKIANRENAKTEISYLYGKGFSRPKSLLDYLGLIGYVKSSKGIYEFIKKELYPDKFRADEIIEITEGMKKHLGVDLYSITPTDSIEFIKDGGNDVGADVDDIPAGED